MNTDGVSAILCKSCSNDLNVNTSPVSYGVDWLKVICSSCGEVNEFSLVQEVAKQE